MEAAEEALRICVERDTRGRCTAVLRILGLCLHDQHRDEEAEAILRKALLPFAYRTEAVAIPGGGSGPIRCPGTLRPWTRTWGPGGTHCG